MRFKSADGVLLCLRCRSRGPFRQEVKIYARAAEVMLVNGDVVLIDSAPGKSEMRAVVGSGEQQLVAKRIDGEEYRDRQRLEQKTQVIDKLNEYYRQTWHHEDSGEEHSK